MVAADPPFDSVTARTSTTAQSSDDPSGDAATSAEPPLATAEGFQDLPAADPDGEETAAASGGRASVKPTRDEVNESAVVEVLTGLSEAARLEAILYLKGRPMSLGELAALTGMDRDSVELALIRLMTDYAHRDTALEIFQDGQTYSLQLRQGLSDLVQVLLPVDLSTAALRTLATIALKKRILQSDLVDLRGSGAYDHIKELLAQNFIERKRQSDGRSYWLTLSEKFHRTFAIDQQGSPLPQVAPLEPEGAPASDYLE
jgi:segregation and condensation protein B